MLTDEFDKIEAVNRIGVYEIALAHVFRSFRLARLGDRFWRPVETARRMSVLEQDYI